MTRLDYRMLPSTEKLKLEARIGELEIALNESNKLLNAWAAEYAHDIEGFATDTISWKHIQARLAKNQSLLKDSFPPHD